MLLSKNPFWVKIRAFVRAYSSVWETLQYSSRHVPQRGETAGLTLNNFNELHKVGTVKTRQSCLIQVKTFMFTFSQIFWSCRLAPLQTNVLKFLFVLVATGQLGFVITAHVFRTTAGCRANAPLMKTTWTLNLISLKLSFLSVFSGSCPHFFWAVNTTSDPFCWWSWGHRKCLCLQYVTKYWVSVPKL